MAVIEAELSESIRLVPADIVVLGRPVSAQDSIRLFPQIIANYGLVVAERIGLREQLQPTAIANVTVTDALRFADALRQAFEAGWADTLQLVDSFNYKTVVEIVDQLGLSDALAGNGTYQVTLLQAMQLTDRLLRFYGADLTDAIGLGTDMLGRVLAFAAVDEAVGIAPQVTPQLLVNVTASDEIGLDHDQVVRMLFDVELREGVQLEAGYISPNGSFTTWAMNTRSGGITEYDNYVFNSFARFGNRYVGACADGLYELLGDDDDGEQIIARIRSGFMQFGGTRLSRLKSAYIAARGEGQVLLKIIEADGKEYLYRSDTRNMRSTKVHMGKGQRSRYFAFELVTEEGQDFDLDTIEFVPIVVARRV